MIRYAKFFRIYESKNREKNIKKQKENINEFLKFEPLIEYVFDTIVDKNSSKGVKYTTWFCKRLKDKFIDWIISDSNNRKEIFAGINDNKILEISKAFSSNKEELKTFIDTYLKTDNVKINNIQLSDNEINKIKSNIKNLFDVFISPSNNIIELDNKIYSIKDVVSTISDWLKSPLREEEINLSNFKTLEDAFAKSLMWHSKLKATGIVEDESGTVLMIFDDGYYWIDLETSSSREEGEAMGHCGTTSYGNTLYSLRKNKSPHVTVAVGSKEGSFKNNTIYQIKGRNNEKPVEKYHKYILELLCYPNVSKDVKIMNIFDKIEYFSTIEYDPSNDFQIADLNDDQIADLYERNPDLISNIEDLYVKYELYKKGMMKKEDFIKGYKDLKIINHEIYFVLNDWSDLDESIFYVPRDVSRKWLTSVLSGDYYEEYYEIIDFDFNDYKKIKPYAFEYIINAIDKHGDCYVNYFDNEGTEHTMLLSKENMKYSKHDNDIIITTPEGITIKFKDLLYNLYGYGDDYYSDSLDWVKENFNIAYTRAREYADATEAVNFVINEIQSYIGEVDENLIGDKLFIKPNFEYILNIYNAKKTENYKFDSILDIINSLNYKYDNDLLIEIIPPYYGFYGTIESDTLSNEIVVTFDE